MSRRDRPPGPGPAEAGGSPARLPRSAGGEAARAVAVEVVRRVIAGAYLAPTLSRALDGSGLAGADRALVTDVSYGTVRRLPMLDAVLAPRLRAPDRLPNGVRAALRAGAFELAVRGTPRHAVVDGYVEVVKATAPRLAGLVNAVLRRADAATVLERPTRLCLAPWLLEAFERSLGEAAAQAAAEGMLAPEPLWLSVFRADADASLRAEGCAVAPGPLPHTLRVRPARPLGRLSAYLDGAVQPQNPSATVPVAALGEVAGLRVLDLAAGAGIKTALLARSGADVTAVDLDPDKARAAEANLGRLGLRAEHVRADLSAPLALPPAPRVLLDAPCTGTGTLRGHPEIKLRLTPDGVARAADAQRAMLEVAASLTAPGGVLVYAVCSLTEAEGEAQVVAFIASHPGFDSEQVDTALPSVRRRHGRYLLPVDGLDGFYLARLRRH